MKNVERLMKKLTDMGENTTLANETVKAMCVTTHKGHVIRLYVMSF